MKISIKFCIATSRVINYCFANSRVINCKVGTTKVDGRYGLDYEILGRLDSSVLSAVDPRAFKLQ